MCANKVFPGGDSLRRHVAAQVPVPGSPSRRLLAAFAGAFAKVTPDALVQLLGAPALVDALLGKHLQCRTKEEEGRMDTGKEECRMAAGPWLLGSAGDAGDAGDAALRQRLLAAVAELRGGG
eukprot:gene14994-biopygen2799